MEKPILAAMLSCLGLSLTDKEKYLFEQYNPIGVSLFKRNIKSKDQLKKLISEIKETIGRDDVLIAIDEEGGRVSRLNIMGSKFASETVLGKHPIDYSKYHAYLISKELNELGINVNYAPMIDKDYGYSNNVLEGRCFSSDTDNIILRAKIMADEYMRNGICPCIKHIPGHFKLKSDPHLLPISTDMSLSVLKQEIAYEKEFHKYPLVMVSHIILQSLDKKNPASQSEKVISSIIRDYLGFDGFLISDAIDMHALQGDSISRANLCINAGLDAICYCHGNIDDLKKICQLKCFLSEKSLERFANIKKVIHNTLEETDNNIRYMYEKALGDELNIKYSYDATDVLDKMLIKEGK